MLRRSRSNVIAMPETLPRLAPLLPRGASAKLMGSSASVDALRLLNEALEQQKSLKVVEILKRAVAAIQAHRPEKAAELALEALERDERSGIAWHVLAIAQEARGDFANSLSCYEAALALLPEDTDILVNLGRLGFRMGMFETAERILHHLLDRKPDHAEGVNNLALAIRAQGRTPEAIEVLRDFIFQNPSHANAWNTLGTLMAEIGDNTNAEIFYREALRLEPRLARARYNLGNLWMNLGETQRALDEVEGAMKTRLAADERAMMTLTRGLAQVSLGRLSDGWQNYEARNDPSFPDGTHFAMDGPRWKPGASLRGKSLLLIGEQGLGDEVLFGNLLPDVLERLGPDGKLTLAVETRLVGLFARSFPGVRVEAHKTGGVNGRTVRVVQALEGGGNGIQLWSPIASLLQDLRPDVASFPKKAGYLKPPPERIEHWTRMLEKAPPGPKIGLLWKSAVLAAGRQLFFSPFEAWESVLRTPGAVFVNLQYGDCEEEIRMARERFGVEIWTPPGIDLKQDLDDVTALSCALDLVIGFSNATFNLAAAAGVPAWLIGAKGAWTALGTDRYPWYPQARLYMPEVYADWKRVMDRVAADLAKAVASRR